MMSRLRIIVELHTRAVMFSANLLLGCGELRHPASSPDKPAATYVDDIKPLLTKACISCHGDTRKEGSYDLSSWRGLLGPGSDLERNAIPGRADSLLLTSLTTAAHKDLLSSSDTALLTDWVVKDQMAYFRSSYHPRGWLYPGDRNSSTFHGGELRDRAWDTAQCEGCHGSDLKGGLSGRSCESCHAGGPGSCGTCHGASPKSGPPPDLSWGLDPAKDRGVGAHVAHANPTAFVPVSCGECHTVPSEVSAAGHLFDDAATKSSDLRAEITFGTTAKLQGVSPTYDRASGTCTVYCHGAGFEKQGAKPEWTAKGSLTCTSCHDTTAHYGGPDCTICHQQSVASCTVGQADCLETGDSIGVRFFEKSLHIDGKHPLGKEGEEGTCYACHGTKDTGGGPAPDLHGRTEIGEITVGLHQIHLQAGTFTNPLPCGACHLVPKEIEDKGHFDDDLPAEVVFSDAVKGKVAHPSVDLQPSWDRKTASCTNTFCHSLDGGDVKQWVWTKKNQSPLTCTSCHGAPPAKTAKGDPHTNNASCEVCHASAFKGGVPDPAKHINGKVDL